MFKHALFSIMLAIGALPFAAKADAGFWDKWSGEDEEANMSRAISADTTTKDVKDRMNNAEAAGNSLYESRNANEHQADPFFDMAAVNRAKPIVICRQRGCTELNDKMTKNFLFNSLANLLYINDKTKVYLCEAETGTRACKSNGLKYAVNIGGTAAVIYIPSLTITDVSFSQNLMRINFMLSYDLYANGLKSFCTSAHNTIEISAEKQALIRDNNYKCQLTSDLPSTSYNIYNIDYVDLDYGIIGAYYSTGMTGASSGGNNGYVLMKFQHADSSAPMRANDCAGGACSAENYRIAPGQYEVLPLEGKAK